MACHETTRLTCERLYPSAKLSSERIVPLSLLDATTADYLATCAAWLFEPPARERQSDLVDHLRQSLIIALDAYPHCCGQLKAVTTVSDCTVPHTQRFGRVSVQYGTSDDPGVEFVTAQSSVTLDELHPLSRTAAQPLWDCSDTHLSEFVPSTQLANPLRKSGAREDGASPPVLAIQLTQLICGGFVLAVKFAHPLADAQTLVHFVKDWASINRAILRKSPLPVLTPVFRPDQIDALAAGDINADTQDETIIRQTEDLPIHRYDWWNPEPGSIRPSDVPEAFQHDVIVPAGKCIPWSEWDHEARVSYYVLHLTQCQVDIIYEQAGGYTNGRISRHDAVLAHIWACINRARQMHDDNGPVYCDLTCGLRPVFHLSDAFLGSPILMVNVSMTGKEVTTTTTTTSGEETLSLPHITQRIRETITLVNNPASLGAYLHRLAFENSPQRIWTGFLGRRHTMVTTWARAGLYEVDFGLGYGAEGKVRYAEGVLSNLDGLVLIKEAPPARIPEMGDPPSLTTWTAHGVDISLHLRTDDMERLLRDPLLFPGMRLKE
ncbi:transferase family protein [Aspergillus brunneoviolaceus CBS 621.78]|uniref:Transferase family protein n=1 Tax=Aspergillus brunneoviolaceus CBS 621.78 TaxID=1450534 RepID=A0ACD1G3F9_9EURO|nr:transferase family protein [Aspergillus brunneoviolaceus CBS 621.78]RAH43760.1 transferase family protein [Aspergillus brunneoviolaceus CBS 621.78]